MKQSVVVAVTCITAMLVSSSGDLAARSTQSARERELLSQLADRETAFAASLGLAALYRTERRTSEAVRMLDGAREILWAEQRMPESGHPMPRPDPRVPVRVGGDVPEPRRISSVEPVYPASARNGEAGVVVVEFIIDAAGNVERARVLRSSPLFDAAALEAVRQWRYEPTLLGGVAVPVLTTAVLGFWP